MTISPPDWIEELFDTYPDITSIPTDVGHYARATSGHGADSLIGLSASEWVIRPQRRQEKQT